MKKIIYFMLALAVMVSCSKAQDSSITEDDALATKSQGYCIPSNYPSAVFRGSSTAIVNMKQMYNYPAQKCFGNIHTPPDVTFDEEHPSGPQPPPGGNGCGTGSAQSCSGYCYPVISDWDEYYAEYGCSLRIYRIRVVNGGGYRDNIVYRFDEDGYLNSVNSYTDILGPPGPSN